MGIKDTVSPNTTLSKPHICVIGSLNIDFVTSTPRCPGPGETLTATSLSVTAGGKGGNQAVACGRASFVTQETQDVSVSMIGAVGADDVYYSTLVRPALEASGIRTEGIEMSKTAQTGSASIIVEESVGGENRILVVPGANHAGMMSDIPQIITAVEHQQPKPGVVVMQGEIPRQTVLGLLEYFNRSSSSTNVIFNPAPVFPEGIPLDSLQGTAVLVMNETEAVQMSRTIAGLPVGDADHIAEQASLNPEELALPFHELAGVQIVLITLGAKGVYFSTCAGKRGVVKGVKVAKVVDTTAAGDTFVGYFSAAVARFLVKGLDLTAFDAEIETAVEKANAAAAKCVQRRGAMMSIPFAHEF
ncbi:Ribokinase [Penicillium lagena]|uniref:Ribokinase n=1 Tax=Penicillium lagena TaxID=94218 RepID=UPI002540AD67|nr:Ribokinase [Penicillium lagena]KAJ5625489.1 Ribokinase [Penicillium lagena]